MTAYDAYTFFIKLRTADAGVCIHVAKLLLYIAPGTRNVTAPNLDKHFQKTDSKALHSNKCSTCPATIRTTEMGAAENIIMSEISGSHREMKIRFYGS